VEGLTVKLRLQFLVIALGFSVLAEQQKPPVQLFLSTPHPAYAVGDPIPVSLSIRPTDASPALEYREDIDRNFDANFSVLSPVGVKLKRLSDTNSRVGGSVSWGPLPQDKTLLIKTGDLAQIYSEPYYIQESHSFTVPGEYNIYYSALVVVRRAGTNTILWENLVTTQPLTIKITEVDSDLLNLAYIQLSDDKTPLPAVLGALSKVRYSKGSPNNEQFKILQRIFTGGNQDIKTAIIRTLSEHPCEESFKIIEQILMTEKNPMIRSEAIAALGMFKGDKVIQLVKDECHGRKERSYRAAVVILGNIGDDSCIDILREISSSDETEWVRQRAKESIEKIKKRTKDSSGIRSQF
jgi:hypothetical protein